MAKFMIHWTEELWYRMEVEAESVQEVLDKFHGGEYEFDGAVNTNVELQDSVEVFEQKEVTE